MTDQAAPKKGHGVLKWALTVGIIIVVNLFFNVAIDTLMPRPDYTDYCPQRQVNEVYETEAKCVAAGGQWNPTYPAPGEKPVPPGYCNPDFTCAQEYSDAQSGYSRNVFTALIVLGALSILGGVLVRVSPAVSAGLSYGGVLSFIIASLRYWQDAGDLIRLGIVGLALVILIFIGVKKFKE